MDVIRRLVKLPRGTQVNKHGRTNLTGTFTLKLRRKLSDSESPILKYNFTSFGDVNFQA